MRGWGLQAPCPGGRRGKPVKAHPGEARGRRVGSSYPVFSPRPEPTECRSSERPDVDGRAANTERKSAQNASRKKTPADDHCWIVTTGAPAFVAIDGPIYTGGPIWRIETVSPRGPARPTAGR